MNSFLMVRARLLLLSVLVVLLSGCNSGKPAVKTSDAGAVKTATPKKKPLRRVIEQPATIEPLEDTRLVSQIAGYVDKVNVDIGKEVKRRDVLAEVSVPEMIQELAQKTALVKQARAAVKQAEAAFDAAQAHILTAEAWVRETKSARARAEADVNRWKTQYDRFVELVADKVLDKQNRDEALNKYQAAEAYRLEVEAKVDSAQAMTKESEAKRNQAKADVAAAEARVEVAQAEEARLQALVEYRNIRAPFDGVVTRRNIYTGSFLQPNASGGPGILFVVARTDTLRIISEIPEAEAAYLSDGLDVKIQAPALKDQTFDGKVKRTSKALDPKSRTLRVEIEYINKEGKLLPGMYANLVFTVKLGERYTLPASALFTHADLPCCWRVDENGNAQRTPLKLGVRDGQDVEVLQKKTPEAAWEAITGNEEIIITNLGAVNEGKQVRIDNK